MIAGFRQNGPILGIVMCLVVAIDSLCQLNLEDDVSRLRLGNLADLQLSFLTILAKLQRQRARRDIFKSYGVDKSLEARPSSFHDVMVTIKGLRAIPRTVLPCCRGLVPNSISVIGQRP